MSFFLHILDKLIIILTLIFLYYYWIKKWIFRFAPLLARAFAFTRKHPVIPAAGVIQLILIALSHGCFCVVLMHLLHIQISIFTPCSFFLAIAGFFIGIGCLGVSTLLCQLSMLMCETFFPKSTPSNAKTWLTIARGGWMRHHLHNVEIMPGFIALLIVLIQISSEEIVFRGIIIKFFSEAGTITSVIISTFLFCYMQVFHMSSKFSAMFPVLGALVLGLVNGILYVHEPLLIPLIIAHFSFFIVAVL